MLSLSVGGSNLLRNHRPIHWMSFGPQTIESPGSVRIPENRVGHRPCVDDRNVRSLALERISGRIHVVSDRIVATREEILPPMRARGVQNRHCLAGGGIEERWNAG